jgi:methylenetetrahydrofolate dehydrogenase (NADP+)/methenyltetrahydrofolate cyclohydrolase
VTDGAASSTGAATERVPGGGAILMDGARLRDEIVTAIRTGLEGAGTPPVCLATVVVGGDRAALANVAAKHRAARACGIGTRDLRLPQDASQTAVEEAVAGLASDPAVHGVFVQLPLPAGLAEEAVLDLVAPVKDVDGLGERSLGRLVRGDVGHAPCTPDAIVRLLARYGVATAGRAAVIVGSSPYVALPVALLLARPGHAAAVTVVDPDAAELAEVCRGADIVVAAAGRAGIIGTRHVRPGATVVDAGVTRTPGGIVGDVDRAVWAVAGAVVPMPGGVGPATIGCLLDHTVTAARAQGVC